MGNGQPLSIFAKRILLALCITGQNAQTAYSVQLDTLWRDAELPIDIVDWDNPDDELRGVLINALGELVQAQATVKLPGRADNFVVRHYLTHTVVTGNELTFSFGLDAKTIRSLVTPN